MMPSGATPISSYYCPTPWTEETSYESDESDDGDVLQDHQDLTRYPLQFVSSPMPPEAWMVPVPQQYEDDDRDGACNRAGQKP